MQYSYELTVAVGNTLADPLIYPVKLASGIVREMLTVFEVGDGYSSCVTLWDASKQLNPTNSDGFLTGDGVMFVSPMHYDLDAEGNTLYLVAWNRGGVYDHSVNVLITVSDPEDLSQGQLTQLMIDTINRLIDLCKKLV